MIIGAHTIIYSRKPEADRSFLRDVLELPHVDAGDGWLIFSLPPSEVAIHPARRGGAHEMYLLCADIHAFVDAMRKKGVRCGPVQRMSWGHLTEIRLPGGGKIGVYQPLHPRPKPARRARPARRSSVR